MTERRTDFTGTPQDPTLTSWVPGTDGSDFPVQNLPYGVALADVVGGDLGAPATVHTAIGDSVLDLAATQASGLLHDIDGLPEGVFAQPSLNEFMALGPAVWSATRARLSELLRTDGPESERSTVEGLLRPRSEVVLLLPFEVADYTDFYSSEFHATNMSRILRPDNPNPLQPNWKRLPVGYHGRAATVVVSGTDIHRPKGQLADEEQVSVYGPCRALDIELELGTVIGTPNPLGQPIAMADAGAHLFGAVLLNDWSARDIQAFEYQPLGPFLAKSFATSISPWVVTYEALGPYRVAGLAQEPPVLDYLARVDDWQLDLDLDVLLRTPKMDAPVRVGGTNAARSLFWDAAQQLAHLTANGASVRTGDLYGSGTLSGPEPGEYGSFMELSWRGAHPLELPDGETRTFLADGDRVTLTGRCGGGATGRPAIGFGEVTATILPAR